MLYLITYDLKHPQQNYREIEEAINKLGENHRCMQSTWIQESSHTLVDCVRRLDGAVDENDLLLVARINEGLMKNLPGTISNDWNVAEILTSMLSKNNPL